MNKPTIQLVHTDIQYTLLKQARANFDAAPKPANLRFLADQLDHAELQELYHWNPGDITVHTLARSEARMWRNVNEGAWGTCHTQSTFVEYVREFTGRSSGIYPTQRDHHLVGAVISLRGATTEELRTFMALFADERFIKPQLGSAIAIRVQLPSDADHVLCAAIRKTLNDEQDDAWPITPSRLGAYFAALALNSHPSLDVRILACQEGPSARRAGHVVQVLLQVVKSSGRVQPMQATTGTDQTHDDAIEIGSVFIPAGKRPSLR
jgi:hypothetical protein